jgi:hypothetical protein
MLPEPVDRTTNGDEIVDTATLDAPAANSRSVAFVVVSEPLFSEPLAPLAALPTSSGAVASIPAYS